jgi:hypothetical protein
MGLLRRATAPARIGVAYRCVHTSLGAEEGLSNVQRGDLELIDSHHSYSLGMVWQNPGFPGFGRDPVVCVMWHDAHQMDDRSTTLFRAGSPRPETNVTGSVRDPRAP